MLGTIIRIVLFFFLVAFFFFTRDGFCFAYYAMIPVSIIISCISALGIYRFVISFLLVLFSWLFYPFTPPDGLSIFYGIPGSGKTTTAAYLAHRVLNHRTHGLRLLKRRKDDHPELERRVFSNVPIKGTLKVTRDMLGHVQIDNGDLLIFDEAGIDFNNILTRNNRSSKKLDDDSIEWLKLFRHYKIKKFVCFSQRVDIDVTLRGMTYRVFIIRKLRIPWLVVFTGLKSKMFCDIPEGSRYGDLKQGFRPSLFDTHFIFSPPLWSLFDTYDAPVLPYQDFDVWGADDTRF